MPTKSVKLTIPVGVLMDSIAGLSRGEKRRLREWLDTQLDPNGEETAVRAARAAFEQGDYLTVEEYIARQRGSRKDAYRE